MKCHLGASFPTPCTSLEVATTRRSAQMRITHSFHFIFTYISWMFPPSPSISNSHLTSSLTFTFCHIQTHPSISVQSHQSTLSFLTLALLSNQNRSSSLCSFVSFSTQALISHNFSLCEQSCARITFFSGGVAAQPSSHPVGLSFQLTLPPGLGTTPLNHPSSR